MGCGASKKKNEHKNNKNGLKPKIKDKESITG